MTTPKDDLGAVRLVVEALEGFPAEEQERIIRWAREKVGLSMLSASQSTPLLPVASTVAPSSSPRDLKTFVTEKKPKNDVQFATTVAFYYRFEAPANLRKNEINGDDLQEGCRLVGRERFGDPGQTLRNAHTLGLLDKGSQSGLYTVNSVGENLVAVALAGDGAGPIKKRLKKKKGRKVSGKASSKK
jgi:hypothetical protein